MYSALHIMQWFSHILDVFTQKIRRKFSILFFLWIKINVAYTRLEVIVRTTYCTTSKVYHRPQTDLLLCTILLLHPVSSSSKHGRRRSSLLLYFISLDILDGPWTKTSSCYRHRSNVNNTMNTSLWMTSTWVRCTLNFINLNVSYSCTSVNLILGLPMWCDVYRSLHIFVPSSVFIKDKPGLLCKLQITDKLREALLWFLRTYADRKTCSEIQTVLQ